MRQKASLSKAIMISIMGIFAIVAGIFVWQQPLYFAKDSSAGNATLDTLILIDAQQSEVLKSELTIQVRNSYNSATRILSAPPTSATITPQGLRQQLVDVFSFNPLKIEGKASIIVILTPESINRTSKDAIQEELETFTNFLANRPGVFPQGYSLYITTVTDSSCLQSIEYSQLLAIYTKLETQHPGVVRSINTKTLLPHIQSCTLSPEGNKALATLFVSALNTFEK